MADARAGQYLNDQQNQAHDDRPDRQAPKQMSYTSHVESTCPHRTKPSTRGSWHVIHGLIRYLAFGQRVDLSHQQGMEAGGS